MLKLLSSEVISNVIPSVEFGNTTVFGTPFFAEKVDESTVLHSFTSKIQSLSSSKSMLFTIPSPSQSFAVIHWAFNENEFMRNKEKTNPNFNNEKMVLVFVV